MGRVLQPTCGACHVAGGAAQSTGFRVTPGDPLATPQSIDAFIDRTNPSESRILQKPLARIPHGGGQQLSPGGETEQILSQWVHLVATGQQCHDGGNVTLVPMPPVTELKQASSTPMNRNNANCASTTTPLSPSAQLAADLLFAHRYRCTMS